MADDRVKRKISAILSADVAGHSRLPCVRTWVL